MTSNLPDKLSVGSVLRYFISSEKQIVIVYGIHSLLHTLCNITIALSLGWYYQLILHVKGPKYHFLANHFTVFEDAQTYFFFLLFLSALTLTTAYFKYYLSRKIAERFSFYLRNLLVQKQFETNAAIQHQKSFGKYLLRYSGDLSTIQKLITYGCIDPIISFVTVFLIFIFLFQYAFTLTLLISSIHLVGLLILYPLNKSLQLIAQKRRDRRSINLNWIANRLLKFNTIKATNKSKLEYKRFTSISRKLLKLGMRIARLQSLIKTIPKIIFIVSLFVSLLFFSTQASQQEHYPSSVVIVYILLLYYLKNPLNKLISTQSYWYLSHVSFLKILEVFNKPKEPFELYPPMRFQREIYLHEIQIDVFPNAILFRDPISIGIRQTSLIISPHPQSASILLDLLTGIHYPIAGQLRIDHQDLNAQNIAKWRKLCTPISLKYPLMGQTIWQALSFYDKPDKFIEAEKLITSFSVHLFGKTPTTFLNTKLDELIPYFSQQDHLLLLWIRALISNKPVFIIDDFFGSLSLSSAQQIISHLNSLKGKKTIVVLASEKPQNLKYDVENQIDSIL